MPFRLRTRRCRTRKIWGFYYKVQFHLECLQPIPANSGNIPSHSRERCFNNGLLTISPLWTSRCTTTIAWTLPRRQSCSLGLSSVDFAINCIETAGGQSGRVTNASFFVDFESLWTHRCTSKPAWDLLYKQNRALECLSMDSGVNRIKCGGTDRAGCSNAKYHVANDLAVMDTSVDNQGSLDFTFQTESCNDMSFNRFCREIHANQEIWYWPRWKGADFPSLPLRTHRCTTTTAWGILYG